jgi:hypothetical protein
MVKDRRKSIYTRIENNRFYYIQMGAKGIRIEILYFQIEDIFLKVELTADEK